MDNIMISCDTSTTKSGVAVFKNGKLIDWKLFDFKSISDYEERTQKMCLALISYLKENKPQQLYIEMPRGRNNPELVRKLTMIIGVIYGWCLQNSCYFEQLPPSVWRKYIEDFNQGNSDRAKLKSTSIDIVKQKYNIDVPSDDVSDAILVGEAVINKYTNKELFE